MPAKTKRKPADRPRQLTKTAELEARVLGLEAQLRATWVQRERLIDERDGLHALIAIANRGGAFTTLPSQSRPYTVNGVSGFELVR